MEKFTNEITSVKIGHTCNVNLPRESDCSLLEMFSVTTSYVLFSSLLSTD